MSYLALYRKYRPSNLDDLVGQSEVANIIKNEILNQKISHAYLFSGPRGTGKTSTAKIIARMINCQNLDSNGMPCGCCESCLNINNSSDVVEIDAASNNGVDEIRELRDKVNLVPTFGKYKIYIIDEVHMLTTQAFNALLKTLEEPPSHVVFILATTEFYKIPITVVSRCQKFQFLKFSNEDIVARLLQISKKENINIEEEVLYEIARLSDGGLRDAINMLDQLSSFKTTKLTVQDVYKLNGVISYNEFKSLLLNVHNNEVSFIVNFFDEVDRHGKNFERLIEDLIVFLKDILIFKNTGLLNSNIVEKEEAVVDLSNIFDESNLYQMIIILNDLSVRLKNSSFGKILVTVEFIKFSNELVKKHNDLFKPKVEDKKSIEDNQFSSKELLKKRDLRQLEFSSKKEEIFISDRLKKVRINNALATASKKYKEEFLSKWSLVEEKISNNSDYVSIAGMLNDVEVAVVGETNVIFLAMYDSLLDRLFSNVKMIENLLCEIFSNHYKVVFLLKDEWNFEKEKYISNLKAGKKYIYIDEANFSSFEDNKQCAEETDKDIDRIVSILGEDIIKYK